MAHIDYSQYIDFNSETWRAVAAWADQTQQLKVKMLIGEPTHDKSNQIRGSLSMIGELLALEKAAKQAANRG